MTEPTRAFRSGLKAELPVWRADDVVDEATAARLAERYRLDEPGLDGPGLLPVYVLGALLVGAGVVSLVAWNWSEMGKVAKLAVIVTAVVGAHVAGDALRRDPRFPRLGEAVTLLGSLCFLAGIALVAQIFQVSGAWYGIFGGFAVGALAAGLLLDSPTTLVAAAVAGVALWGAGFAADQPSGAVAAVAPWVAAAPFLALGWWRRQPSLLGVAALSLGVAAAAASGGTLFFVPALLIGAGLLAAPLVVDGPSAPLGAALAVAGRILAEVTGYALSFKEMARFATEERHGGEHGAGWGAAILPAMVAMVLLGAGIARRGSTAWSRLVAVTTLLAAGAVAAGADRHAWLLVATGANVLVAVAAVSRLAEGIAGLRRGAFWEGIGLGGLLLISRFLEIERLLWLKGLGFIACGTAVTWAAVRFERRRAEVRHAA